MTKVIQNVDALDIINLVQRKKRVHIRTTMDRLEKIIDKDSEEFVQIRKLILDHTNDFSRMLLKEIFGDDFEGINKP